MSNDELLLKQELAKLLEEKDYRKRTRLIDTYFPAEGKYSIENYPKHVEFMNDGTRYPQRAFIAANRVGKTLTGGCEAVYHLTGEYPSWWKGRRFERPIKAWICSITPSQMKDAVQSLLFGSFADKGTGLIPKEALTRDDGTLAVWSMSGTTNVVGTALVRHKTNGTADGWSQIEFKTYEQGWEKFQGAKIDLIWLDEEPRDYKIFTECLTRTAGDDGDTGIIYCTFTPLMGYSETVLSFLPDGQMPRDGVNPQAPWKKVICAGWDDVPHLSQDWKQQALAGYAQHERDARSKGIPSKGSGAIYPYPESDIVVRRFNVPEDWPRCYGMDVGWNCTAVVWIAYDQQSGKYYVYDEHYLGERLPIVHAAAVKARGKWITGAIDPTARGVQATSACSLMTLYYNEGLSLVEAKNDHDVGIAMVAQLFASGQLLIMDSCVNTIKELRIYRRDENGKIVKKNDHAMDALRYAIVTGVNYMSCNPELDEEAQGDVFSQPLGRSKVTGY